MSKSKGKPPKKLADIFASVVILADHRSEDPAATVAKVHKILKSHYANFELVVVANGLHRRELKVIREQLTALSCIRVLQLARAVDIDTAIFAGLEAAIGDYVCVIHPAFHQENMITKLIEENRKMDIVLGVSKVSTRRGLLHRAGSRVFYWYSRRFLGMNIDRNSTYFMCLSRRVVNSLTRNNRHARHVRQMVRRVGYEHTSVEYEPKAAAELDRDEHFFRLVTRAFETAASYSSHPLRSVSWIGVFAAVLDLLYAGYVVAVNVLKGHTAEGWTSLSLQSATMFFLIFVILVVMCEYIGRILEEARGDSPYHVADEYVSTISVADETRRNIAE